MEDFCIDNLSIEKILRKYKLGSLKSVEKITTGLINPIYLVNEEIIIRIGSKMDDNPDKFKREAYLFTLLPKFGIPTPKLFGLDESEKIIKASYILMDYIPGQNLQQSFGLLDKKSQKNISYELGSLIKRIHSITPDKIDTTGLFGNIETWISKSIKDFEIFWQVVKTKNYFSNNINESIIHTFEKFKKILWHNHGRLIHGDFSAGNIQIRDTKIVGIFDFEFSFIADPLWDLQKFPISFQLGDNFNKVSFLQGYGLTAFSEEEKIRLKMHCFHQGIWEIWATITQKMPFNEKEMNEGIHLVHSAMNDNLLEESV